MTSRPLLAAKIEDPERIPYPLWVSPKVDGIRCLIRPSGPVSRKFKPIPNDHVRLQLTRAGADFFDGEIITLTEDRPDDFNIIQSKVMRQAGKPTFLFLAFDHFQHPALPFDKRLQLLRLKARTAAPYIRLLHQRLVYDVRGLLDAEQEFLSAGFEGLMARTPSGPYKPGRSTLLEAYLLKLKRFDTAEGILTDVLPLETNVNPQTRDELGYAKRSTSKSGLVPLATAGKLVLRTRWGELSVGSGLSDDLRSYIWKNKSSLLGALVTFKYLPHGMKDKPRHPIFIGFRHPDDTGG